MRRSSLKFLLENVTNMSKIEEFAQKYLFSLNYSKVTEKIVAFIKRCFEEAGVEKAIVGVSGGVDSSTTLMLTVKALGSENVIALIMPHEGITPQEDVEDARSIVKKVDVTFYEIEISRIAKTFKKSLKERGIELEKKAYGNILARTRMILLYAVANQLNGMVVGTGDKSEILLGYFTKYGDGGVDILPIGCLYKTQVRLLAKYLGVPEKIAFKPSSPRLWPGQTAEGELGFTYREVDPVLYALFELKYPPEKVVEELEVDPRLVKRVLELHKGSEHKRRLPPVPSL